MGNTSAIALVFDGLNPGFLGPYGNTWFDTPGFNQLAAESLLVEHAICDVPDSALNSQLRSVSGMWDGRHAMCLPAKRPGLLWRQCAEHDVQSTLVCDDPRLAQACAALGFDQIRSLPEVPHTEQAGDVATTRFAQLIGESLEALHHSASRYCLWIHASTLVNSWDAPAQLLEGLLDQDDPAPSTCRTPPAFDLGGDDDPDTRWGLAVSYAAQVRAVDACLSVLIDALHQVTRNRDVLFLLSATHGYPLGEHGVVGAKLNGQLNTELVHVPLLMRYPRRQHAMLREQRLCQSPTIYATLADWLGCGGEATNLGAQRVSDLSLARAVSQLGQQRSIRTPAWHAVMDRTLGVTKLYAKPDDRWDVNDVAGLCPNEVALLETELEKFAQAAGNAALDQLESLPEQLLQCSQ